ncbi:hypothetical protein ND748_00160 [Frankia sp. AiPs1]|uniref:hypothetical protein n=1 Tax=Frankia sp. AiPs1 TaxID=573493 RepID=UPI00204393FD|nr:hypothetical protein [Frankia sp. AiPs1]MCM3920111.1 hypothetical protein [Frankia sp. AiPs1]
MTSTDHDTDGSAAEDDLRAVRMLLAGTDPSPQRPPTCAQRRRAAEVLRTLRVSAEYSPGWRGRLRARATVASAAAVVVLALLLTAVNVIGGRDTATAAPLLPTPLLTVTGGDRQAAVGTLLAAARDQRTAAVVGVGPVRYTVRQTYGLDVTVARRKATTTATTYLVAEWRRPDGSRHVDRLLQQVDRAGHDVGGPQPAPTRHGLTEIPAEAGEVPLPTDPGRLRAALEAPVRAQGRIPSGTDVALAVLGRLREGDTTAAQNAALFEVLAEAPGVFDAGRVTDRAGRDGRAVGVQVSGPESLTTAFGYLLLSGDGEELVVETVYLPSPPPGLKLPKRPTVADYTQFTVERQVTAVGQTG